MVLYDFYADWCGPCKIMAPIIDQFEKDFPDIVVARINVDESPETAADYAIQSIPTYILEYGDKNIRLTGAMPKHKFYDALGLTAA
jgi:thioredoxin 1